MKQIIVIECITILIATWIIVRHIDYAKVQSLSRTPWWNVQSVDTMKYSRDLTAEKINDLSFDAVIDQHVREISDIGATHVAIATPYDEEFVPMLRRWVNAARKYNLSVWFRGNFSGWEEWFKYQKISRDEHLRKTDNFILKNPDLFIDGDIFTSCPECENGGPGDPRNTRDVEGHRQFLITEYEKAKSAFSHIGKNVSVGYFSINYDVASLIMDKKTTAALGGIVTIDHYIKTPEKLASDVHDLSIKSGGKIFLGEFGVPLPDINGKFSDKEQAQWITSALEKLLTEPTLIGLNYWVGVGGSTQIWDDKGNPKLAVSVLKSFFMPKILKGIVTDQFNRPIKNVKIQSSYKNVITDSTGHFNIPVFSKDLQLITKAEGYANTEVVINNNSQNIKIIIEKPFKNTFQFFIDNLSKLIFYK